MIRPQFGLWLVAATLVTGALAREPTSREESRRAALAGFLEANCLSCHEESVNTAGVTLDAKFDLSDGRRKQHWESVLRKLSSREMPPLEAPRPTEDEYNETISFLAQSLDAAAAAHPNPGRTETFRRLTRTEYQNVVRDLLALDVDVDSLLPADESSHGFDNITVSDLSPALLNRYLLAAEKISGLTLGKMAATPEEETVRLPPDLTQDVHIEGLPIGTRGGALIEYNFPLDGKYEIRVRLMRDRNENIEGLRERHDLEVLLDRERVALFTVEPPSAGESDQALDANLNTTIETKAGPHKLGVTFLARSASLLETMRQPLNVHYNFYRHPRIGPAIYQVSIIGPLEANGPGDTPSSRRVLICTPGRAEDEEQCAQRILSNFVRRAYRRPVTDDDLRGPMAFYREGRSEVDFAEGVRRAVSSVLVNPNFLFRIEREPPGVAAGAPYRVSDVELASRLSFFVWSSMPDDELLDLAEKGELSRSEVLEQQVRRMLQDDRSRSLVENFAGQWLHLRNLESFHPDMRLFPDFDDNLRQAMRKETELLLESIMREDRSVLDLLQCDYTFLNERLAKHYEIPNVYGDHFRRVALTEGSRRGGLLRHASILAVTSYPTRTSPVIRGHWVLKNLLGSQPPPPPPDVPALADNTVSSTQTVRERLEQHRSDPACASCHQLMDPVGLALENFDALGRWRDREADEPIDASGGLFDGSEFVGPDGLEKALLDRPELFVRTLAEKLLTYALGRGVEFYDAPAIRRIVSESRNEDFRFSSIVQGIVRSTPFQMRMSK